MTEWQALLAGMARSPGASPSELARLRNPPAELVDLLRFANGAKSDAFQLWSVDEIVGVTAQYEDYEPARGLLFVGTDGGREMLAYDLEAACVLLVDVTFESRDVTPWREPSLASALVRIARSGLF